MMHKTLKDLGYDVDVRAKDAPETLHYVKYEGVDEYRLTVSRNKISKLLVDDRKKLYEPFTLEEVYACIGAYETRFGSQESI